MTGRSRPVLNFIGNLVCERLSDAKLKRFRFRCLRFFKFIQDLLKSLDLVIINIQHQAQQY